MAVEAAASYQGNPLYSRIKRVVFAIFSKLLEGRFPQPHIVVLNTTDSAQLEILQSIQPGIHKNSILAVSEVQDFPVRKRFAELDLKRHCGWPVFYIGNSGNDHPLPPAKNFQFRSENHWSFRVEKLESELFITHVRQKESSSRNYPLEPGVDEQKGMASLYPAPNPELGKRDAAFPVTRKTHTCSLEIEQKDFEILLSDNPGNPGQRVGGFSLVRPIHSEIETTGIFDLQLNRAFRGYGIGRAILKFPEQYRYDNLTIQTVTSSPTATPSREGLTCGLFAIAEPNAARFYQTCGLTQISNLELWKTADRPGQPSLIPE